MRILAVDPSLRSTGLAGTGWSEAVATRGYTGHDRLQHIKETIALYAKGADLVVIEGPAYGAKGRAVHQLAGLWWLATHRLWSLNIPYAVVDPMTLKVYACNNGRASKEQVAQAMCEAHPSMSFGTDDESDAYALLTMAYHHYLGLMGCCDGLHPNAPHHERTQHALGKVEWPEI